ncbi:CYTH domain-containing protein [Leptolyngbya sp. PCC 6406]|uniref:CYTH domain-containing protein n=1 Tax=Leptolyngbya sp. PCC 6406 TaxID=1173264 RepID=UPI0002ACCF82|nr:CYTH domain-containing protein [Leptolyngbya sp. PCC 6406]
MALEIERKFLVTGTDWRALAPGVLYRQGYIPRGNPATVRVRIAGERGYLTLKGPTQGLTRSEFEYEIPRTDAEVLLDTFCETPFVEKMRYRISFADHVWEVDEFLGQNQGLVLAEIELTDEAEPFERLDWVGLEVSDDPRYRNANLAHHPYATWTD